MNKISLAIFSLSPALVFAVPTSQSGGLPLKPAADQSIFFSAALSIFVAVVLLALVCYGLIWWRKRFTPSAKVGNEHSPIIKNIRRTTQKTTLITVAWQGKTYLLAEGQGTLLVLDSVPFGVDVS